jgi:hypothetical protein
MTCSKFHTEGPQILDGTVQNLVAQATWCATFVQSSSGLLFGRWQFRILAENISYPKFSCGFALPLHSKSGKVSRLGHSLPDPFDLIIHTLS